MIYWQDKRVSTNEQYEEPLKHIVSIGNHEKGMKNAFSAPSRKWNVFWASKNHITRGKNENFFTKAYGQPDHKIPVFTTILRILKKSKWERAFHLGGHHLSKLLVVDGAVKTDQVIKLSALILSFGKKTFIQPTHPLLSTSAFAIISSSLWSDMPGLKNEPILIFFQEQIYLKTCSKQPQEIVGFIESRWEIGNAREPVDESKQSYNF